MLLQMRNYKGYNNYKDLSSYQISIVSFVWVKVSNNFYDIMIWFLDPIQAGTFPLSTLPPPPPSPPLPRPPPPTYPLSRYVNVW